MSPRPDTHSKFRSRSSTRTSRTFGASITFPPTVKVGRYIVKSWARKWECTKRHTNVSGCSVTRSGARQGWWWTPAFIRKVGRANRRSSTCTITPRYPSMRSKRKWTVTSPGPGKLSLIIWASSRSCVPAKRRRKRSERNSTSALSTMPCSSSARYRCLLSQRGSTVSSPKAAKALTRIWSKQVSRLGSARASRAGFGASPKRTFFFLASCRCARLFRLHHNRLTIHVLSHGIVEQAPPPADGSRKSRLQSCAPRHAHCHERRDTFLEQRYRRGGSLC